MWGRREVLLVFLVCPLLLGSVVSGQGYGNLDDGVEDFGGQKQKPGQGQFLSNQQANNLPQYADMGQPGSQKLPQENGPPTPQNNNPPNLWWQGLNAFQRPPGHPGVQPLVPSSNAQQQSPQSNYNKPAPSFNAQGTGSGWQGSTQQSSQQYQNAPQQQTPQYNIPPQVPREPTPHPSSESGQHPYASPPIQQNPQYNNPVSQKSPLQYNNSPSQQLPPYNRQQPQQSPSNNIPPPQQSPPNNGPPPQQSPPNNIPPPQQSPPNNGPPPQQSPPNNIPPPQQSPPNNGLPSQQSPYNSPSSQQYPTNISPPPQQSPPNNGLPSQQSPYNSPSSQQYPTNISPPPQQSPPNNGLPSQQSPYNSPSSQQYPTNISPPPQQSPSYNSSPPQTSPQSPPGGWNAHNPQHFQPQGQGFGQPDEASGCDLVNRADCHKRRNFNAAPIPPPQNYQPPPLNPEPYPEQSTYNNPTQEKQSIPEPNLSYRPPPPQQQANSYLPNNPSYNFAPINPQEPPPPSQRAPIQPSQPPRPAPHSIPFQPTQAPRQRHIPQHNQRLAFLPGAPEEAPVPYPGCPAAMLCVQDEYCNTIGLIEENPIKLSAAEKLHRVALMQCSEPMTGIVGVCCRDPNYVDPWPDMNNNGIPIKNKGGDHHLHRHIPPAQQGQKSSNFQPQQPLQGNHLASGRDIGNPYTGGGDRSNHEWNRNVQCNTNTGGGDGYN